MNKITEAMIEAAWQAFGDCPIDMCGDHDEEQKKCVVAAVEAALSAGQAQPVAWRVFEDIQHGWWGIEVAGDVDAEPILYPIKMSRERITKIVDAHNDALSSGGK